MFSDFIKKFDTVLYFKQMNENVKSQTHGQRVPRLQITESFTKLCNKFAYIYPCCHASICVFYTGSMFL